MKGLQLLQPAICSKVFSRILSITFAVDAARVEQGVKMSILMPANSSTVCVQHLKVSLEICVRGFLKQISREDDVFCLAKIPNFTRAVLIICRPYTDSSPAVGVGGCQTRLFLLERRIGGLTKGCKSCEYHACVVQKWATRVRSAPKS